MQDFIANMDVYLQGAPLLALAAAFAAGLLTSFTPCVYPLIPVTVAVIGARSVGTKTRALLLSLVYVLGLATVYAGLGAFAALSGQLFGQISTNKWTFLIVGNIFLLFGLAMLDVFTLQFTSLQKLSKPRKGPDGVLSVFFMGGVSALIAGPCTTPVLGTMLVFVAQGQNIVFGIAMLFVFSLGLGALLIIVGTFAGALSALPKSGGWMVGVKKIFGFLMIIIGEFFILKAGQLML
jgi:thiol:disulfide interchange protein DsbD